MLSDAALWQAINAYPLPISARLARENSWSMARAEAVMQEYKRFIYLICISGTVLTPSDAVDEAWHLHLLYTRDYWEQFCGKVLGRPIHHTPATDDGDSVVFRQAYAKTLRLYISEFGPPPPGIWPHLVTGTLKHISVFARPPERRAFLWLTGAATLSLGGCALAPSGSFTMAVLVWLCVAVLAGALFALNVGRIVRQGLMKFLVLAGALSVGAGFLLHESLAGLISKGLGQTVGANVAIPLAALAGFVLAIPLHLLQPGKDGSGCGSGCGSSCGGSCGGGCSGD